MLPEDDLRTLLEAVWAGGQYHRDAAWRLVVELDRRGWVEAAVRRARRVDQMGGWHSCEDAVSETLAYCVAGSPDRDLPVFARPAFAEDVRVGVASPVGFLRTVVRNAAVDVLRRHDEEAQLRAMEADRQEDLPDPIETRPDECAPDLVEAVDGAEAFAALVSALRSSPFLPHQSLVYLLWEFSSQVLQNDVEAAAEHGASQKGSGLLRGGEETGEHLGTRQGPPFPQGSWLWDFTTRVATREEESTAWTGLAWILRSQDATNAEAWRRSAPDEAQRARETVQQWRKRCFRKAIQEGLLSEGAA